MKKNFLKKKAHPPRADEQILLKEKIYQALLITPNISAIIAMTSKI